MPKVLSFYILKLQHFILVKSVYMKTVEIELLLARQSLLYILSIQVHTKLQSVYLR